MEKQSVGRPCAHQAAVALAGCGRRPPAAFSRRFEASRTARVRFASSLAAAWPDGHVAHPAGDSDTEIAHEFIITSCATMEGFRRLLGLAKIFRAGSPVSLSEAGPRWRLAHFSSTVSYVSCRQVGERAVRLLKMAGDLRLMYVSGRASVG